MSLSYRVRFVVTTQATIHYSVPYLDMLCNRGDRCEDGFSPAFPESSMLLYSFGAAPNPRRTRMFLAEKSITVEIRDVDLSKAEQRTAEYLAINPHGTVPVLVLDDGQCICSVAGIRAYGEAYVTEPALMGRDAVERGRIADAISWIESDFLVAVAEGFRNSESRMQGFSLPGPVSYPQLPELAERGKLRAERYIGGIEDMIGGKSYLMGDEFTAADIDLFIGLRFASWIKLALPQDAKHALAWYDRVQARPSAKA